MARKFKIVSCVFPGRGEAGRLWRLCADHGHARQEEVIHWHTLLDGTRGEHTLIFHCRLTAIQTFSAISTKLQKIEECV